MQQQDEKPTCASSKGHFWQSTSSPLIFRCSRTGCRAMRHCINGVWHETYPTTTKPTIVPGVQQTELWTV
jgi:hypothetical protein